MITRQRVLPMEDHGRRMVDGPNRIATELAVDGRRPSHSDAGKQDAEAQEPTYHQWCVFQKRRASAADPCRPNMYLTPPWASSIGFPNDASP